MEKESNGKNLVGMVFHVHLHVESREFEANSSTRSKRLLQRLVAKKETVGITGKAEPRRGAVSNGNGKQADQSGLGLNKARTVKAS